MCNTKYLTALPLLTLLANGSAIAAERREAHPSGYLALQRVVHSSKP
jgi:hypothetical protein